MTAKKKVYTKKAVVKKLESVESRTTYAKWVKDVGSKMEGKHTPKFILYKAKEAFGVGFDENRYQNYAKDNELKTLNELCSAVWGSHS